MKIYNCIECEYNTTYSQNFKRHLKSSKHNKIMNKSICNYCKKDFEFNSKLQRHLKNKNICSQNTPITQITQFTQITQPPKNIAPNCSKLLHIAPYCSKIAPNCSKIAPNPTKIPPKYTCEHCDKNYSRNSNLTKHKKSCKSKIQIATTNININSNNTITNNIQINNYGNENISYLKNFLDVIKDNDDNMLCFLKFLQLKHMNPEHKENWNIQYPTLKDNYSFVKSKDGWESQIIDDIVNINFKKGQEELEELFNNKAIELGNIDKYGVFLPEKEKKILDKIDKQIYEATPQNIKVHKNAIKKHKSDLYYHLKNYKSFFKK